MPFALNLHFDPDADGKIREIWKRLESVGVPNRYKLLKGKPHLSVAVWEELEQEKALDLLPKFARDCSPFELSLATIGLHAVGDVYLLPDVPAALVEIHAETHRVFGHLGQSPWDICGPASWLPHVTVGYHVEPDCQLPAISVCKAIGLPLTVRVQEIGLMRFHPIELVSCIPFGSAQI